MNTCRLIEQHYRMDVTPTGRRPAQRRFREKLAKPLAGVLAVHAEPWRYEPTILRDPETGKTEVLS